MIKLKNNEGLSNIDDVIDWLKSRLQSDATLVDGSPAGPVAVLASRKKSASRGKQLKLKTTQNVCHDAIGMMTNANDVKAIENRAVVDVDLQCALNLSKNNGNTKSGKNPLKLDKFETPLENEQALLHKQAKRHYIQTDIATCSSKNNDTSSTLTGDTSTTKLPEVTKSSTPDLHVITESVGKTDLVRDYAGEKNDVKLTQCHRGKPTSSMSSNNNLPAETQRKHALIVESNIVNANNRKSQFNSLGNTLDLQLSLKICKKSTATNFDRSQLKDFDQVVNEYVDEDYLFSKVAVSQCLNQLQRCKALLPIERNVFRLYRLSLKFLSDCENLSGKELPACELWILQRWINILFDFQGHKKKLNLLSNDTRLRLSYKLKLLIQATKLIIRSKSGLEARYVNILKIVLLKYIQSSGIIDKHEELSPRSAYLAQFKKETTLLKREDFKQMESKLHIKVLFERKEVRSLTDFKKFFKFLLACTGSNFVEIAEKDRFLKICIRILLNFRE